MKNDILGKKITEVIILQPDRPVTMSTYSHSDGYLEIEGEILLDLGTSVEPLKRIESCEVKNKLRDRKYENEFKTIIGKRIIDITFPDLEEGDLDYVTIKVTTEKDYQVCYSASMFWNRPVLEKPINKKA